jgi:uncharacterized protein (TIGR00255 family)
MIRSMTGFGSASSDGEAGRVSVAARALNHRFLDLSLHLPRRLQGLEPEMRKLVQSRIQRGRVELSLQTVLRDEEGTAVVVSTPVVAGVVGALRQIQAQYDLAGKVRLADVIRFPGALEVVETDGHPDDERRRAILALVESALESLDRMRQAEGENLERDLLQALAAIEAAAARLETASRMERETRREALLDRTRALRDELGLEEARLYQEVVRLVDRQDVAEELQRLRSHVGQARDVLREGGPCGKRLDFLAQELAREANTVGSKSASAAMAREVVDLKGEVERLREQVQNVE